MEHALDHRKQAVLASLRATLALEINSTDIVPAMSDLHELADHLANYLYPVFEINRIATEALIERQGFDVIERMDKLRRDHFNEIERAREFSKNCTQYSTKRR